VFKDLAANVDVVLCNFTSRVLPSLGFDFDTLRALNPGIVVVRMPAFGNTGPFAECAGYALIIEAMAGFAARFGYPDEGARVSDTYWPDSVAGTHAALAIMTGIERRDRTGEGVEIDLSHQDAMWQQLGEDLVETNRRGAPVERLGNEEPGVTGSGIEADGHGGWVAVVGERREPVLDPLAAAADPRQVDRFEVIDRDVLGPHRLARPPFVVDGRPGATRRAAPMFDEHTDEVLAEVAGYTAAQIAALRKADVVGGVLPTLSGR
jgi:crotonobetainyl-CoA:carnitine CoA-transferase CaiB-like acyl-CoA transferase